MSGDTRQIEDQPIGIQARKKWLIVAICVLAVGSVIIANLSFVAGLFDEDTDINFDDYKTVIGKTTENSFGKLTLNEVMVDDNQLLLNATFDPEESMDFDHQIFFFPQLHINGKDLTVRNRGQSVEQHESKYTIYSSIQVSELPQNEKLTLDISYNKWNLEKPIDQPWDFQVEVSQKQILADKKIFSINEAIPLTNGNEVTVTKVVSTPISTTIYYYLAKSPSETVDFKIKSASGESWRWDSGYMLDDEVVNRFDALYLTDDIYYLIPIATDDKALGPSIQIGK